MFVTILRQFFLTDVQKKFVIYIVKEYEYLIVSDLHLTSLVCQHEKFEWVIKNVKSKNLILNGDIIDVNHTKKLNKKDWHILSLLRKQTNSRNCIWNAGNHDADVSKILSEFIGYEHSHEVRTKVNSKKIIISHGDQFDSFIGDHPIITNVASGLYYWLQAVDPKQQRIPRYFKKRSKNWIHAASRVRNNAVKWAKNQNHNAIICSHVHTSELTAQDGVTYGNTGCFTYPECFYITIDKRGNIELHSV
jgi:UDP-2,3-diacylglucosamine pyrophosphatase LpxH